MTTNQFFELPLGISLTMRDLMTIHDALFVCYHEQEKKHLNGSADVTKNLFDRMTKIINNYQSIE